MIMQARLTPLLFLLTVLMVLTVTNTQAEADARLDTSDLELEVIDLLHRPAEDVLPILQPFVLQRATIKGTDFKIIIRSTRRNINEIKQLIEKTDVALRKLLIYISTDRNAVLAAQEAGISARLTNNDVSVSVNKPAKEAKKIIIDEGQQTTVSTRVFSTTTRREEHAAQKVLVQEGQWAVIRTGKSVPLAQRTTNPDGTVTRSVTYKSISSGFRIRPQLRGNKVHLEVQPQQESLSETGGGVIEHSSLYTTVSARLGQWLELGGGVSAVQGSGSAKVYSTETARQSDTGIFVKVELQK